MRTTLSSTERLVVAPRANIPYSDSLGRTPACAMLSTVILRMAEVPLSVSASTVMFWLAGAWITVVALDWG
jgi:hypothetical protein